MHDLPTAQAAIEAREVATAFQTRFGSLWLEWSNAELDAAVYGYQAAVAEHEQRRTAEAIDVSEVNTLNVCGIASGPEQLVRMLMPQTELTRDEALVTAAYLVLVSEISADGLHHERFLAILDKVANT